MGPVDAQWFLVAARLAIIVVNNSNLSIHVKRGEES